MTESDLQRTAGSNEAKMLAKKEHKDAYRELKTTESKLQDIYDASRTATLKMKASFNDIRQKENVAEMLRNKYYDMLAKKPYNESDRDEYFFQDQVVHDTKDLYIEETQKLAHDNSMYVAYSNRLFKQREEFIEKLLKDVDAYYLTCQNLTKEKEKYQSKCTAARNEIQSCKNDISFTRKELEELNTEKQALENECKESKKREDDLLQDKQHLSQVGNSLRADVAKMTLENKILTKERNTYSERAQNLNNELGAGKTKIASLCEEINDRKKEHAELTDEISDYKQKTDTLSKQKSDYIARTKHLAMEIAKYKEDIAKAEKTRDTFREAFKQVRKERDEIFAKCEQIKKEKENLHVQHKSLRRERELVGREKDKIVSQEYHTRKRNQDLVEDHKHLVKLVEEFREKYHRADDRAKKDWAVKQDLRDTIKRLHREMEEERKKWIKQTRDMRTQTDADLACESRDIAIQHAQFKMKQALRARDRALKEKETMEKIKNRSCLALDKKSQLLSNAKLQEKKMVAKCRSAEDSLKHVKQILAGMQKELAGERAKLEKEDRCKKVLQKEIQTLRLRQQSVQSATKDSSSQTPKVVILDQAQREFLSSQEQSLHASSELMQREIEKVSNELTRCSIKNAMLEKVVESEKSANEILRRKILHIDQRYTEERNYVRSLQQAVGKNTILSMPPLSVATESSPPVSKARRGSIDGNIEETNCDKNSFYVDEHDGYSYIQTLSSESPRSCGGYTRVKTPRLISVDRKNNNMLESQIDGAVALDSLESNVTFYKTHREHMKVLKSSHAVYRWMTETEGESETVDVNVQSDPDDIAQQSEDSKTRKGSESSVTEEYEQSTPRLSAYKMSPTPHTPYFETAFGDLMINLPKTTKSYYKKIGVKTV